MNKPSLYVERLSVNHGALLRPIAYARGDRTGDIDDRGGATFSSGVGRGDVVVPAWAVIYNERVGLPLTTGYPMLKYEPPSAAAYRVEVDSGRSELVDGLASATLNSHRVRAVSGVHYLQLPRRGKRKKEGNKCER